MTGPSLLVLDPWLLWSPLWVLEPSTLNSEGRFWAGVVWPGSPLPLQGFGQLDVPLTLHPHLWPCPWGLASALEWLLPWPVWVRVAINMEICWPRSAIPSPSSVGTAALALTLSLISSFSLFTFLATISCSMKWQGYYTNTRLSPIWACRPHGKGNPWGSSASPGLSFFWGIEVGSSLGSLLTAWQRMGPSHYYHGWLYKSSASEHLKRPLYQR